MRRLKVLAAAATAVGIATGPASAATGPQTWGSAGCGGCHTLQAAGSTGTNGPNLDALRPSAAAVADQVSSGGGGMPSYGQSLSATDIQTLASWVSTAAGGAASTAATPTVALPANVVRKLQADLGRLGFFHGPITGFYGPLTTAAVKRFQRSADLKPDGIWGPHSAAALRRRLH